jgi:hypothetical protein
MVIWFNIHRKGSTPWPFGSDLDSELLRLTAMGTGFYDVKKSKKPANTGVCGLLMSFEFLFCRSAGIRTVSWKYLLINKM